MTNSTPIPDKSRASAVGVGIAARSEPPASRSATRLDVARERIFGAALAVVGLILFLTYGSDGLIIRLGSTTTTACVVIALGLALAIQPAQTEPDSH